MRTRERTDITNKPRKVYLRRRFLPPYHKFYYGRKVNSDVSTLRVREVVKGLHTLRVRTRERTEITNKHRKVYLRTQRNHKQT